MNKADSSDNSEVNYHGQGVVEVGQDFVVGAGHLAVHGVVFRVEDHVHHQLCTVCQLASEGHQVVGSVLTAENRAHKVVLQALYELLNVVLVGKNFLFLAGFGV